MPFIFRHLFLGAGLVAAAVGALAFPAFANAPRQLYNKTIQINWSVQIVRADGQGQKNFVSSAVSRTVYVSSGGRLFERASRSNKRGKKQTDNAPDTTRNKGGEATGIRFSGNRLIGHTAFAQGARQWVATFDSSFSKCTVAVTFGREGGAMKRRGIDGVMHTNESMTASGESCSIRDGNPFGD
ncbi:hypothetical protein [Bradyrhizobium sp.]|uniref:hypothetical protein n=1 Tax=Bradyrhizobium sp. TaxID=376 RepID=UPI002720E882|nr:hypothetical protein [Bradyrhizobium sp.]MDO9299513.1 hypothetical protein [Bradyrhizobium sp.]